MVADRVGMAAMTNATIRRGALMASAFVVALCYLGGPGSGQLCQPFVSAIK